VTVFDYTVVVTDIVTASFDTGWPLTVIWWRLVPDDYYSLFGIRWRRCWLALTGYGDVDGRWPAVTPTLFRDRPHVNPNRWWWPASGVVVYCGSQPGQGDDKQRWQWRSIIDQQARRPTGRGRHPVSHYRHYWRVRPGIAASDGSDPERRWPEILRQTWSRRRQWWLSTPPACQWKAMTRGQCWMTVAISSGWWRSVVIANGGDVWRRCWRAMGVKPNNGDGNQ